MSDRSRTWVMNPPVVVERAKRSSSGKSRKPRSADANRIERSFYRAARHTSEAAELALRRYDKARRASRRQKRDGAILDLVPNATRGMVVGSTRLALVPLDLMRVGTTRSVRRMTRRSLRAASRTLERP